MGQKTHFLMGTPLFDRVCERRQLYIMTVIRHGERCSGFIFVDYEVIIRLARQLVMIYNDDDDHHVRTGGVRAAENCDVFI